MHNASVRAGSSLSYSVVAFILSSGYLYYGARLAFRKSNVAARQLLMASIIYLPLVFFLTWIMHRISVPSVGSARLMSRVID